ncbi:MAG: prolyl-tRNA synthetase associated domain-containing protein [Bacteroidales bacterium]
MIGDPKLYSLLGDLQINYSYHEHPPVPTIEEALKHWAGLDAMFCKNLFFRNHKGNRHYLVVLRFDRPLDIHDLEKRLRQGKISFASDARLEKYLGLQAGSVSPLGLINDAEHHVHVFLDENLREHERLAFHPNDNRATLIISRSDLEKFLLACQNQWEYISLYE